MIECWSRSLFFKLSLTMSAGLLIAAIFWTQALWGFVVLAPFVLLGLHDIYQTKHTLLRNFPILGHFRFLLESIRPEVQQYLIEGDDEEHPFSREKRSVVYQRAKGTMDTLSFGTRRDVYRIGYEWINHSLRSTEENPGLERIIIGEQNCASPYSASMFNISAMSYGALSRNAVIALNRGAKAGGFYHNTGEGGISDWHLQGGDLVWQIGTGYFGCRRTDGTFCEERFQEQAAIPAVKMIEIKLSQGAKPGHGGILPAAKVSEEVARIRGVPVGQDVISPSVHKAFSTPVGLLEFITRLRGLSGEKPVGIKLCIGEKREFFAICKAMLETHMCPDFITIDGAEGGTGAAPLEFANSVGMPLADGLALVHSTLVGVGMRDRVRVIAAGKITTGFHLLTKIALGADLCNSARGMMFALGCIQARKCNSNQCPSGVATQLPRYYRGLDVADKTERVTRFHRATVHSSMEITAAADSNCTPENLRWKIMRRTGPNRTQPFGEIYPCLQPGQLLDNRIPESIEPEWAMADAGHF